MKSINKVALISFLLVCPPIILQAEEQATDNKQLPRLNVSVIPFSEVAKPVERDVEAELVSLNNSQVSAQLSARVEEILNDVGDQVFQGDVLARLDCRDFDVAVRQAKAGVNTVKARIAATKVRANAAESQVQAAVSRSNAAASRVSAAVSQVSAAGSQVKAALAQSQAARSRVEAAQARVKAATVSMQSTGSRIKTAQSRVNTAKSQSAAAGARVPAAQGQFNFAQAQLKRNQQLRNQKLIAADVLEQAQSSYQSALGALGAAKADAGAARAGVDTANAEVNSAQADFRAAQAEVEATKVDIANAESDVATQQANVETHTANVDTNKANADVATAESEVAESDVATAKAQWEAAKADLVAAETELESALAQLESAEVVAERCNITAPFDGQIIERQFQLGQVAAPGTPAFMILQTGDLEVSARLSSDEISDQEKGASLRFIADDEKLSVEPRAVVARIDQTTGTQEARFKVLDLHALPVGKTGRLRWQGQQPSIPASWLLRRDGKLGLMLAVDDKAKFYPVANAREGQPALVDLPPDTLLINDNRLRVRDGQSIESVKPE